MPRQTTPPPSRSQCESWLDAIPLGSLDQLQNAAQHNASEEQVRDNNAPFVPLPTSKSGSSVGSHTTVVPTTLAGGGQLGSTNRSQANGAASGSVDNLTLHTASAGSLWQLQNADTAPELGVPLPASSQSSQEQPQPAGTGSNSGPAARITATAVSGSPGAFPNQGTTSQGRQQHPPVQHINYWQRMTPLMECLPHLRTIGPQYGRHNNVGAVSCIDYYHASGPPKIHNAMTAKQLHRRPDQLRQLKTISDPEVATRVILVEDLSPGLIELLGSTFQIDPEFYAEHLNRAGYDGVDYNDALPMHWETRNIPKAHASVKWYRPAQQNPKVTEWLENPGTILNRRTDGKKENMKEVPGSITWYDPEVDMNGNMNEYRLEHQAVVTTNVFRRSWSLSTRPRQDGDTRNVAKSGPGYLVRRRTNVDVGATHSMSQNLESSESPRWRTRAMPTAWEERASYFRYDEAIAPIIILLLDPLPAISDFQTPMSRRRRKVALDGSAPPPRQQSIDMFLPMVPRAPLDFPVNKFEATESDIERLKRSTEILVPIADAIRVQLDSTELQPWRSFRADPILALLRVVQIDSKAFFQNLEWALDEISQDSLDDYLMTRRLADWRALMSDFEIEVPAIGSSLDAFVDFVFKPSEGCGLPKQISDIITEIDADISRLKRRLDEAYAALRADMQFTESRRSITEAKTVTKLTELAFIFIPLSFTSSLFSMSIRELQNGVPVWTFVVTALTVALLSFGIRLIVASDFVADNSRKALERFWARRDVRRGESAPIFTLVVLTTQEVWRNGGAALVLRCSFGLFISAFVVVPVAFIWTSNKLDLGFHIAMTLFLVLSGLAFAVFIFVYQGGLTGGSASNWFSAHPDSESVDSGEEV